MFSSAEYQTLTSVIHALQFILNVVKNWLRNDDCWRSSHETSAQDPVSILHDYPAFSVGYFRYASSTELHLQSQSSTWILCLSVTNPRFTDRCMLYASLIRLICLSLLSLFSFLYFFMLFFFAFHCLYFPLPFLLRGFLPHEYPRVFVGCQ